MKLIHPIEVLQAALDKAVELGLITAPGDADGTNKALAALDSVLCTADTEQGEWVVREMENVYQPVKVGTPDEIPLPDSEVLFVDMALDPPSALHYKIERREIVCGAICFIGAAPDWAQDHVMAGHKAYQLPRTTVLAPGKRNLERYQTDIGQRWVEVIVGKTKFQPN